MRERWLQLRYEPGTARVRSEIRKAFAVSPVSRERRSWSGRKGSSEGLDNSSWENPRLKRGLAVAQRLGCHGFATLSGLLDHSRTRNYDRSGVSIT